jgi:hypothetical protein
MFSSGVGSRPYLQALDLAGSKRSSLVGPFVNLDEKGFTKFASDLSIVLFDQTNHQNTALTQAAMT